MRLYEAKISMIAFGLVVFDKNTWNLLTECKQMIIEKWQKSD